MRFWIIGNGFDLHHGLKTRYLDYKTFLCQSNRCLLKCGGITVHDLSNEVCRFCDKSRCIVRALMQYPRKIAPKIRLRNRSGT